MPLRFARANYSDSLDLVHRRVQRLSFSNRHRDVAGRMFDSQRLDPPHAVYTLNAEKFAAGTALSRSVRCNGYRFLVRADGQLCLAAEVHPHHPGRPEIILNSGPFVGATAHALRQLVTDEKIRLGSYEVRLLRCFPLYFMALWLKADSGGDDLFYPLAGGAPPPFEAERLYRLADFQGNIQEVLRASRTKS